jgi:hypothetical protein
MAYQLSGEIKMSSTHKLSKSRFLSGYQCSKKLWFEKHRRDLITPFSTSTQRILDQGTYVGELAQAQFPGGVLIEADHFHIPTALIETKEALDSGAATIFEGCFIFEDILIRADVMVKEESGSWRLIEVKSTTKVKPEHIIDLAVQKHVLEGCGIKVASSHLMHIDNQCVYPDLDKFFVIEDISSDVIDTQAWIPRKAQEYLDVLAHDNEPIREIGQHCTAPYTCPFISTCWDKVPMYSIFTLPGLWWKIKTDYINTGHLALEDIREDVLNERQLKHVQSFQKKAPIIDKEAISNELQKLEYPLFFLDFETDGPAVPRFDGMRPFQQFPFQFSCHVLKSDGELTHSEYLHENLSDPRQSVAKALVSAIGPTGSIIAFNAPFEIGYVKKLAQWIPDLAPDLLGMVSRFWDQLPIFQKHYIDYRFLGSASIKDVLPVLVTGKSYGELNVSGGTEAQAGWNAMINENDPRAKEKLSLDLLEYCGQDTYAMVEIHRVLMNL